MPKKKLEKIVETNGKIEETKFQPTTLDEAWGGFNATSKFGTNDRSVYEARVNEMNRTDLEAEGRRLGTFITESTARLRENCLMAFDAFFASLQQPIHVSKPVVLTDEARKILAEGR